jgi:hypothetical protein
LLYARASINSDIGKEYHQDGSDDYWVKLFLVIHYPFPPAYDMPRTTHLPNISIIDGWMIAYPSGVIFAALEVEYS